MSSSTLGNISSLKEITMDHFKAFQHRRRYVPSHSHKSLLTSPSICRSHLFWYFSNAWQCL